MKQPYIENAVLQDDWLRRVARALVHNEHAAEDLAQDAWVAALGRGRTRAVDRPWLGGLLRHRNFADRRKAATRFDRERGAARGEATPAADEIAAQMELRELVSRALRELDEPYRTAVYLHFVEGKSMRELAEQLDVATSTAHSRVNGGVNRLRQRLDAAHGGDRRTWLALMVPWSNAAAPVTTWSTGLGLIAMGAAVAVAAAAGIFMLKRPAPTEPVALPPVAVVPIPTAESLATIGPSGLRTQAALPPPAAPPLVDPSASVTSTLSTQTAVAVQGAWTKPDGSPAAGAPWTLKASRGNNQLVKTFGVPADWEDLKGTLGADGRLELSFEAHPSQQYDFELDHPSFVPMKWRWSQLKQGEVKNLGDIELKVPGQIHGTLVGPHGAPLGFRPWRVHAKWSLGTSEQGLPRAAAWTETDEQATFVFDRLPEGLIQLELQDRNLGWIQGPLVQVESGEATIAEFPFTPPAGIEDRVIVNCLVVMSELIDPPRLEQLTLVDAGGTRVVATRDLASPKAFVFDGLGDGEFRLELDDPRLTLFASSKIRRGTSVLCLVRGSASAQLSVTGPDGAPVMDYSVELSLQVAGAEPKSCTVRTNGNSLKGDVLLGMVPGDYELAVRSGLLKGSVTVPHLTQGETRSVAVTLARENTLAGRILHPDGTPAANVMVRLITPAPVNDRPGIRILDGQFRASDPSGYRGQASVALTDEDGNYSLPLAPAPALIVLAGDFPGPMAETPPFSFLPTSEAIAPGPIDLVLPKPARFEGKLLIPDDTHLAGWKVVLWRPGVSQFPLADAAHVSAGGHFSLGPTAAGECQLILHMTGGGTGFTLRDGALPSGTPLLGTVTLVAGKTGSGEYEYPGAPLIHASLAITGAGAEGEFHNAFVARTPSGPVGLGAANGPELGPFRLEPGTHRLMLAGSDWIAQVPALEVSTTDGATIPVTVQLTQSRVQVTANGVPVPSIRLGACRE